MVSFRGRGGAGLSERHESIKLMRQSQKRFIDEIADGYMSWLDLDVEYRHLASLRGESVEVPVLYSITVDLRSHSRCMDVSATACIKIVSC